MNLFGRGPFRLRTPHKDEVADKPSSPPPPARYPAGAEFEKLGGEIIKPNEPEDKYVLPDRSPGHYSRTEDLTREGYCNWHGGSFNPGGHWNRESLVERGICPDCEGWRLLWERRDVADSVRIGGEHYILGQHTNATPGMAGRQYTVRFFDKRGIVETNDLWHQGKIPTLWRLSMPDNAEFIDATIKVTISNHQPDPDCEAAKS